MLPNTPQPDTLVRPTLKAETSARPAISARPKILLVDDDDPLRSVLRFILEHSNCAVTEASCGESALGFLSRDCPDVLITDIIMPGVPGLEVIGKLKLSNPGAKIIAMSGSGQIVKSEYLKMAVSMGADAVLVKPFPPEQLISVLKELLGPWPGLPAAFA